MNRCDIAGNQVYGERKLRELTDDTTAESEAVSQEKWVASQRLSAFWLPAFMQRFRWFRGTERLKTAMRDTCSRPCAGPRAVVPG